MQEEKPIPHEFSSIEEIQNFWDDMEGVDFELAPALQTTLELKKLYRLLSFSTAQIAAIEVKAQGENVNSKQLISKWILEHV